MREVPYFPDLFGKVNPESVAETAAVSLWAAAATALINLQPQLVLSWSEINPAYLFVGLALSVAIAFAIIEVPLAWLGYLGGDREDLTEWDE